MKNLQVDYFNRTPAVLELLKFLVVLADVREQFCLEVGVLEEMLTIWWYDFFERVDVNIVLIPIFYLLELIFDHVEGTHRHQL